MATPKAMSQLKLETGWLCLDFANTMDWHASEHPVEGLTSVRSVNRLDAQDWPALGENGRATVTPRPATPRRGR